VRGNSPGLPVAGDAKTYNHLHSLKKEHSHDLKWLLPMPGDWHTLKNYQPLFMTVYSDAGLKHLAEASGFQSATLTALLASQNFHTTHNFLMQSAEAILREMIQVFMKTQPSEKQELIKAYLANASISDRVFKDSITRTESLLHSGDLSTLFEAFNRFIIKQSTNDATWFVLEGLYFYRFYCLPGTICCNSHKSMQERLRQSRMFEAVNSNRGLVNFLAKIKASPEQEKDLLNFHSVGQKDYEGYVDYCILRVHATTGTQRQR